MFLLRKSPLTSTAGYCFCGSLLLLVASCAMTTTSGGGTTVTPESAYCSTVTSYTTGYTITGAAAYRKRLPETDGLSSTESSNNPIRYAEIQVLDSTGTAIQCAETDASGNFSFIVPQSGQSLSLVIYSRGSNTTVKASVLNAPTTNVPYAISTTFTADASKNVGTIVATATGDTIGAAFNILDQIVKANLYLIQYTANCSTFYATCTAFTPSVKISAYWSKGLNPGQYINTTSSLSFYLPGQNQLYILGGRNGDSTTVDTDHFDDSIIVHEYGHFIEDNYAKTDSPGGYHSASFPIDPRLAWGEGWANFFSSATREDSFYRDSCGVKAPTGTPCSSANGHTGYYFYEDMDNRTLDIPSSAGSRSGEGNFRELAITRTLWSFQKSPNQARFNQLWANFSGPFKATSEAFRSVGLFLEKHTSALTSPTAFSSLTTEQQIADRTTYARPLSVTGTCTYTTTYGTITTPTPSGVAFGATRRPLDWLANNDIYDLNISTPGAYTFTLTKTAGSVDADLYLYSESHRYIYESSTACSGFTLCFDKTTGLKVKNDVVDSPLTAASSISATLTAGRYLLMVNFFESASSSVTYRLQQNGSDLCP